MSLRWIISEAFGFAPIQIVGPKTLDAIFTIAAKLPDGANKEDVPEMLQDLLQKRFGLVRHIEVRNVKSGRLRIENPEALEKHLLTGSMRKGLPSDMELPVLMPVPLSSLTRLSDVLRLPVLAGDLPRSEKKYLFWLETADGPSSVASSLKNYGIRLEFGTFEVPFLIIDSINSEPVAN